MISKTWPVETDFKMTIGPALKDLVALMKARTGSFWLYNAFRNACILALEYDKTTSAFFEYLHPLAEEPAPCISLESPGSLFADNSPRIFNDLADIPLASSFKMKLQSQGVRTALINPLHAENEFIGSFVICNADPRPYHSDELEMAQALARQAALLFKLSRQTEVNIQMAALEERHRIAREIHDTLAQSFTGIILQLRVAQRMSKEQPEEAWKIVENIIDLTHEGLAEARRTIWFLQSESEEYGDLAETLSQIVLRLSDKTSAKVELHVNGTPRSLPPEIGINLFYIGQEAIRNAISHAEARIIWVELTYEPERLLLRVQDDGNGFDLHHRTDDEGFGLIGMDQRARSLGGQLSIISQPGRGAEVAVSVPLAPKRNVEENR